MRKLIYISLLFVFNSTLNAQNYSIRKVITKDGYDAYSPVFYNNKIIYCSNEQEVVGSSVYDLSGKQTIDLFSFDTSSKQTSRYDSNLKTNFNDGPISFTQDNLHCVFSRNKESKLGRSNKKEVTELELFSADLENGKWTNIQALPFCKNGYSYTHPFLNDNGDLLIFASNCPGGFGGYDLWKVTYNGTWGEPVNLGDTINSESNEVFPTLVGEQLYFSSDKKDGLGGLDIYTTYLKFPSKPIHLLDSINSTSDDFGVISNQKMEFGYFSSNRNGNDAIFSFKMIYPEFTDCNEQEDNGFCFSLFEENAAELDQVELIYQWKINDETINGVSIDYCFPGPGDYHVSLNIIDTVLNQTYFEQASYDVSLENIIQAYIDCPDTVQINTSFQLNSDQSYLDGATILNHFWEDGNGNKSIDRNPLFSYSNAGTYEIKLGLVTAKGEEIIKYCSTKQIVVLENYHNNYSNFLLLEKVNDSSVVSNIDNSANENSYYSIQIPVKYIEDNDLKHILAKYLQLDSTKNISIILSADSITYDYCIGAWKSIDEGYEDWKYLLKEGIVNMIFKQYHNFGIDNIAVNKEFKMNNILFKPGSYILDTISNVSLNKLSEVLTTVPFLKIDISGHTDSDGNGQQNLILSKYRVESIGKYLIKRGVDKKQIKYLYFGESRPIAPNTTEEGKAQNRRVEFKLILE